MAPTLPHAPDAEALHSQRERIATSPGGSIEQGGPSSGLFEPESQRRHSFQDEVSFDEAMVASSRVRWCIDRGPSLDTMTTFELWLAIASGQVERDVRVWREGLECWTEVEQVPDLACALVPLSSRTGAALAGIPRSESDVWAPSTPPLVSETDPQKLVAMLGADPLAALDQRDRTPAPWGVIELPGETPTLNLGVSRGPAMQDPRATLRVATSPTLRSRMKEMATPEAPSTLSSITRPGQVFDAERTDALRLEACTSPTPAAWTAVYGSGALSADAGSEAARAGQSRLRSLATRAFGGRRGARWIALGSAAALAMGVAVTGLANTGGLAAPATCATPVHARVAVDVTRAPDSKATLPGSTPPVAAGVADRTGVTTLEGARRGPLPAAPLPRRPEPGQQRRR